MGVDEYGCPWVWMGVSVDGCVGYLYRGYLNFISKEFPLPLEAGVEGKASLPCYCNVDTTRANSRILQVRSYRR